MRTRSWLLVALWTLGCGGAPKAPADPSRPPGPQPSPVAAENALAGGAGWKVTHCGGPGILEAYASAASVNRASATSHGSTQSTADTGQG